MISISSSAAHWLEQAELAEKHAASRPVGDICGYAEAMIDAKRFRAMAAKAGPVK